MQQIGSLARKVLQDAKRAKEARDKLRLAGGLLGPAEFTDQPTLSRVSADEGRRAEGEDEARRPVFIERPHDDPL